MNEKQNVLEMNLEDYEEHEAVHSDHEGITSGEDEENEEDAEHENNYDLNDSFINNKNETPVKLHELNAHHRALHKTPKHLLKNLLGKNHMKWMSQVLRTEQEICNDNASCIDAEHEYNDMSQYEDPDDPILPPWDPEKEGQYCLETESSSEDEPNIAERMRRPYLQQTQQRLAAAKRKRKYSEVTEDDTHSQQPPKRRKLVNLANQESPFFSQPSIAGNYVDRNISDISPLLTQRNKPDQHTNSNDNPDNNHNKNDHADIITSDLAFLQENAAFFTDSSFCQQPDEYMPFTSPMLVRTPIKTNTKNSAPFTNPQNDVEQDAEKELDRFTNLDGITWANLVTRECDQAEPESANNLNLSMLNATSDLLTPAMNASVLTASPYNDDVQIIMDASENQKACKVNEILRNKYKIKPIISSLDFVQYVIGDSIAVLRRKETDMIKGEQIATLKRILYNATDRYKSIVFIVHRLSQQSRHRIMGIGAAKKLDKNLQNIALSSRVILMECLESEQVAETIVSFMKLAAKTNKHNHVGVPFNDAFEDDGKTEKKLTYLRALPCIGYSEAIWLLREFNFSIANIINCPDEKLAKAVPSLAYNERHKFLKYLMKHKWQKSEEDESQYSQYMQHSSAVKQRRMLQSRNRDVDDEQD